VQGIIDGAYDSKATRANAIIPENMGLGYWADAPAYGPDVAKAKEYLAASGKSDITLKLTTTTQENDKTTAEIIQANLKDIGITVEIDAQDSAAFYEIPGGGGGGKDRQLVYSGYTSLPDPSWSIVWFTKAQLGEWNWCDWTSPSFEANYKAGLAEFDDAKRNEIYIDMQKEWDESASMAWIMFPNFYYTGQSYVKPSIQPNGWVALWNFGVV
jgi:peptide/nickel transport system substrate-binding protein